MLVLAFACGASVANLYYAQPLLGLIRQTFGVSSSTAALVVTVTQVGYALGLALLLPLGDLLENRRLSSRTLLVTAVALAVAAAAPGFGVFLVALALVGVTSVVAISAAIMLVTALALARLLPRWQPRHSTSYARLVASSAALARAEPLLVRRALSQALMFGAFTAYWTAIVYELTGQHHLTQAGIAVFALVGAAGAIAAPVAGRLADRGLGVPIRGLAIALGVAALLLAATEAASLVLLALSAILLDFAVQGGHVMNMRDIYALRPDARARMNSVYMTTIFAGGAASSAAAGPVSQHWGWPGVAVFAAILVAAAGLVWVVERFLSR
jgi:predicted MFS family arabinose efflux permease